MSDLKRIAEKYAPKDEAAQVEIPETQVIEDESPTNLAEAISETPVNEEIIREEKPSKKQSKSEKKSKEVKMEEKKEVKMEVLKPEDDELGDYEKGLIAEYEGEIEDKVGSDDEKKVKEPHKPTEKELAYDELISDSFMSSYLEWKKSGGQNPKDFIKELGITSKDKTIEDYIRDEAKVQGFSDDELEDIIKDELDEFNTLSELNKRKKLNSYKEHDKGQFDEKIKSFSNSQKEKLDNMERVKNASVEKLKAEVGKLNGAKFKGMLIDEPMAEQIMKDAPIYSPPIFDDNGAVSHYDVEKGILSAIAINYLPKLLKETYNLGRTAEAKKYVKERHRPNADSVTSPAMSATSPDEELSVALKGLSKKMGGFGN